MSGLAGSILTLPPAAALLMVFLLPLLESSAFVGFVAPGELAVILGGVLANQHKVSLTLVMTLGIAGAILGDSIGYEVGRRYGLRMLARIPDRLLSPVKVARAQAVVRRLGGKAVFVGRFTTSARVIVPGIAGMASIPYRRFLAFNIAGGALWTAIYVFLGYALGSQYKTFEHNLMLLVLFQAAAVVIALVTVVVRKRRRCSAAHGVESIGTV